MTTLVIVQARTGSRRLPRKVLLPLAGRPMLARQLERMQAATTAFDLVVATTSDPADDAIREICRTCDVDCASGHPTDLLDRHYHVARRAGAEVVVKVPSDCPLIDPGVIDRVLAHYQRHSGDFDFVSNLHPPTWPDGNDVEVLPFEVLETAWRESTRELDREHTTPFVWDQPDRFRIGNVRWETGLDLSTSHRFTVDYEEDHAFVAAIYDALWSPTRPVFRLHEILDLLAARPDLRELNEHYVGVNWYRHYLRELATIDASQTRLLAGEETPG